MYISYKKHVLVINISISALLNAEHDLNKNMALNRTPVSQND